MPSPNTSYQLMLSPQSKHNELLGLLRPSLSSGEKLLDDIEIRSIIRQARQLEDGSESKMLEGLACFIRGDVEQGIELCEQAIALSPHSRPEWSNYIIALCTRYRHFKSMEVITRASQKDIPILLIQCMDISSKWLNLKLMDAIYPRLVNFIGSIEVGDEMQANLEKSLKTYAILKNMDDDIFREISSMANVVMEIAEEECLPLRVTSIVNDFEGTYAFRFGVKTEDHNYLSKLDDQLFERLISHGIKSVNCIAYFELTLEDE